MENSLGDAFSVAPDFANSGASIRRFLVHPDKDLIYADLIPKVSKHAEAR